MVWCVREDSIGAPYLDSMAAKFLLNYVDSTSSPGQSGQSNVLKRLKYGVDEALKGLALNSEALFGTTLGSDWTHSLELLGSDRKSVKIEYLCEVRNVYEGWHAIDNSKKHLIDSNESNVWPVFVELTNGRIYGCDFIVNATGVAPNAESVLNGNHFSLGSDGGLLVNNQMMTSEADVYAAGDVCSVGWHVSEQWFQMRLWTQARQMGIYAAQCMAAHVNHTCADLHFNFELFAHMTRFFGHKVVLLGLYNGQKLDLSHCRTLVRVTPGHQFVKVILRDGIMMGAVLIGETDLEETFENLILNRLDLSSFGDDLLETTLEMEDYFD